ncbi:MAG: MFS transporter [Rhodospirillaceae bacterium]
MSETSTPSSPWARIVKAAAMIEPHEMRAVVISFLYFFFLLGSYYILRPMRDAMGTVYGSANLEELFTYVFFATFIAAPIYAAVASKVRLSRFLPWIYGFFIVNIFAFYALFVSDVETRVVAGAFYIWVSVFNMFIISVFWSFMADVYSRKQAKRLYGVIAAGGSFGAAAGPAVTASLVTVLGNETLLLISGFGFLVVVGLVVALEREKARFLASSEDVQRTTLDHSLNKTTNPFAGFSQVMKSPYLMMFAAFILLLTWVSTILYFQQAAMVEAASENTNVRTQIFASVDLVVNTLAVLIQLFGTGRLVNRFGVTSALVLVPGIMLLAFLAMAVSPVLMVVLGVQVVRRVSEYAIAKPGREMLFTIVDQESKYKAKNVLDTVVYRFGDVSQAWVQAGLGAIGLGVSGIAIFGAFIAAVWGFVGLKLGRKYESAVSGQADNAVLATAPAQ